MQLSNYLFFTTTCEQALEFYTQCGLGRVSDVYFGKLTDRFGVQWMLNCSA